MSNQNQNAVFVGNKLIMEPRFDFKGCKVIYKNNIYICLWMSKRVVCARHTTPVNTNIISMLEAHKKIKG